MSAPDPAAQATSETTVLRHLVATLAYRAAKVIRDAPAEFAQFSATASSRRPVQIVAHLADLMAWGVSLAHGEHIWQPCGTSDWDVEVARFFERLAELDRELTNELPAGAMEKLIQGPLADALTHVGQLAMLRGLSGSPIRPESYARAEIARGRVGLDQAPAAVPFDGDASFGNRK